jgi:hypothetical protein
MEPMIWVVGALFMLPSIGGHWVGVKESEKLSFFFFA